MKNIDIEIYMNNFKLFFERNPHQLLQLIGNAKPEDFFNGVKDIVIKNSEDEERPIEPTRQQLIDLIVELNGVHTKKAVNEYYFNHHMGPICLN